MARGKGGNDSPDKPIQDNHRRREPMTYTCSHCGGRGHRGNKQCTACRGSGYVVK